MAHIDIGADEVGDFVVSYLDNRLELKDILEARKLGYIDHS